MGAYLSEPNKDKQSSFQNLEHLSYGASSMQGWRASQEDAHNCIPKFDDNTSLFAVYDGHGGAEVAQYCALRLPDYIKSVSAYKNGNLAQALEDAFLGFDELLTNADVINELSQMIGVTDRQSDEENEVDHLFAEANMPLHEVLAKYQKKDLPGMLSNPSLSRLKDQQPQSPCLRAVKSGENHAEDDKRTEKSMDGVSDDKADLVNGEYSDNKTKDSARSEAEDVTVTGQNKKADSDSSSDTKVQSENGDDVSPSNSKDQQPGCSCGPTRGKRTGRTAKIVVVEDSEDTSNSEDENYKEGVPYEDDSDSEEEGEVETNKMGGDDSDDDDADEDDDDDDDDEDENEAEEDPMMMDKEEPGADSGCTAVVALLRGDELYVANAGDSRCIVCRNGKAIDMSVDHKPEDELEKRRIEKAGGKVTEDRRVNGGLNLSRAIGDHTYKRNPDVALKDQMISALPDIRTLTIDPVEDEFMVLACDGIWNSMSSQEVADFVQEKLLECSNDLSTVCEMMFDQCLAPHTKGDGTGCDNMTAIVVRFHKDLVSVAKKNKRRPDAIEEQLQVKQIKVDEMAEDHGTLEHSHKE